MSLLLRPVSVVVPAVAVELEDLLVSAPTVEEVDDLLVSPAAEAVVELGLVEDDLLAPIVDVVDEELGAVPLVSFALLVSDEFDFAVVPAFEVPYVLLLEFGPVLVLELGLVAVAVRSRLLV